MGGKKEVQTIRGWRRRGGRALVRHGSDGGEEVGVGEVRIRRWRWSAWIPATLEPPPALSGDGSSGSGRRGGRRVAALVQLPVGQALPGSDRDIGGESGGGELRVLCPGPPPVLI